MIFIIGIVLLFSIILTVIKVISIKYKHKIIAHNVWLYEKGSGIAWLIIGPLVAFLILKKDSFENMILFLLAWVVGFLILYFFPKYYFESKK